MGEADKWEKLEGILEKVVRRVVKEEIAALGKKDKLGFANGRWTGITEAQLSAWRLAYGSVEIQEELNKMAAWIVSNPHLAPKSNFARFANTWLSRCQDRSAIRSIPTRSEPAKKLCEYCDKVATGSPNRIWACEEHFERAMHHEPVPMFKNAVAAKNVTGER